MIKRLFVLLLLSASFSSGAGPCAKLIDKMENMGELKAILRCLDKHTEVSQTPQPHPFQKANIKSSLMLEGYRFELESCFRKQNNVTCSLVITNKNKTVYPPDYREFGIYTADSNFFDEYGQEYPATSATMGKVVVESQGPSNRKDFQDGYLEKYMPIGIPMRLQITFAKVRRDATTVLALNIRFSHREGKSLASKFVTLESIGINES